MYARGNTAMREKYTSRTDKNVIYDKKIFSKTL